MTSAVLTIPSMVSGTKYGVWGNLNQVVPQLTDANRNPLDWNYEAVGKPGQNGASAGQTARISVISANEQTALADVANAVAFLASDEARWITGVTLPLGWAPSFALPVAGAE